MNIKYPNQAKELIALLEEDQIEKRKVGRAYFDNNDKSGLEAMQAELKKNASRRGERTLEILNEIGGPYLSNIGSEAAVAIAVLGVHGSIATMKKILATFTACYERQKDDTQYQSIPALADWILILERKPQRFGTIWLFDDKRQPYLPAVEDFDRINERRAEFDIEPLRWPKSMAIPESEQPWLQRPLSELVMRNPTDKEFAEFAKDFL